MGSTTDVPLPVALAVPADSAALQAAVTDAVSSFVETARHAREDAHRDGDPLPPDERRARAAPQGWVEDLGNGGYAISVSAQAACAFISAAANNLLPAFVRDRYRLQVALRELPEWFASRPLDLVLHERDQERSSGFDIERAADGHRLWIQLALLDALEEAGRVESYLWRLANKWREVAETISQVYQHDDPQADDAAAQANALEAQFDTAVESMAELVAGSDTWVTGELEGFLGQAPAREWTRLGGATTRFYIVDEPERHLQPRRQREAAQWLAKTADERRAPCLLASHSPSFLALPGDVTTYVFVDRHKGEATFRAFEPSDIAELDAVAEAMGYDRGELLSLVGAWLVVEGPTDLVVLKRLFAGELHRAGVGVVPIRGTARWRGLLEADALWRYTRVPVAVMFDNVSAERVRLLNEASDEELRLIEGRAKEEGEVQDIARLIRVGRETGQTIEPVPNSGTDITSFLDEQVLKELTDGKYPGHDAADAAYKKHNKGSRDEFMRKRYGLTKDVGTFQRAADLMAERGIRPAELAAAIDYCAKLTDPLRPRPA
jgi:AAA domain, putative AbiEii toxin, Type IV TA system